MKILMVWFLALFCGDNISLEFNSDYYAHEIIKDLFKIGHNLIESYSHNMEDISIGESNELSNDISPSESTLSNMFYYFNTIVLLLIATAGVFYVRHVRDLKRALQRFVDTSSIEEQNIDTTEVIDEKRYITKEKELSILSKIADFEREKGYLDKDISLNQLASSIGVNHRYLSYVVNKNKECDFATYVNELRIGYIVACLEDDPKYLKYKISYLAEQCGFASHSRFTVTFKKMTGCSPSVFINKLKR